jgi:hypothetical protein
MEKDLHNIEKFKSQQIEYYKELREKKFKELDIEFFKALEVNDREKIEIIAAHKNKLRDITEYEFPDFEDPRDILDHVPKYLI